MDTLYLLIVGAIGWTGFIGCAALLYKRDELTIMVMRPKPSVNPITSLELSEMPEATIGPRIALKDMLPRGIPEPYKSEPLTIIEPEIPEEMHRLAEMAEPLLDQYDTVPQSGEWKRHQVYAAMLKNPKVKEIIGDDKWKAGFALELAVAQRRMNAEEVGA